MTLITIREEAGAPGGSNAKVVIEGIGEYPVTVSDLFNAEEESRLEWYFERWQTFPFTRQIEVQCGMGH